ncbi:MAG: hypothetical protein LBU51_04135 [Bacteroidales bacterium]|jgi:hypothetical protein|nr:hypothetical protein [Bacteroidales bacterium]
MIKKSIILLIAVFFASCEPLFHDDFIIANNCDEDIYVSVTFYNGQDTIFVVNSYQEYPFYYSEWVGGGYGGNVTPI